MYKLASESAQRRTFAAAVSPRRTEVDRSTWRDADFDNARADLIREKKLLEGDLAEVTARIVRAKKAAYEAKGYQRPQTWDRWNTQRAQLIKRAGEIDAELGILKREHKRANIDASDRTTATYERAFITMAKRMLAGDVYERLVTATIHSIREENPTNSP